MKGKTMILMAVALGFGVVAAWFTYQLSLNKGQQQTDYVEVLVATQDLTQGTRINEPTKQFKTTKRPKQDAPKGYISDYKKLEGKSLRTTLMADSHVTEGHLGDYKGPDLKEGTVGYAIGVNQERGASGYIRPGAVVNVLLAVRTTQGVPEVKTLLERKKVVAVNEHAVAPEGKAHIVPTTALLQVTPQESELLAQSKEMGTLSLALLPPGTPESKSADSAKGSGNMVKILVAKHELKQWQQINEPSEDFTLVEVPKDTPGVPANAISNPDQLKGHKVNRLIAKNCAVTADDLGATPGKGIATPVERPHVMMVVNGNKVELIAFYKDGRPVKGGISPDPGSGPSVPESAPPPAPAPVPAPDGGSEGK